MFRKYLSHLAFVRRWFPALRLRWKLTFSYTLVTASAILLAELALLVGMTLSLNPERIAHVLEPTLQNAVPMLAPALKATPPERGQLQRWLRELMFAGRIHTDASGKNFLKVDLGPARISWAAFLDPRGRVVAVEPETFCDVQGETEACLPYAAIPLIDEALTPQEESRPLRQQVQDGILLIVPMAEEGEPLAGALVLAVDWPGGLFDWLRALIGSLLPSAVIVILLTALLGTAFGYFTARGLTQRLTALTQAANAWSRGDFSVVVRDAEEDELGSLARRLNAMAEQLQSLLQNRETLATLEERHRLARELHDSVKQQVFSVDMQLAVVEHYLTTDPDRARQALEEAQSLLRQAQHELHTIIRELRPVAMQDQGLVSALRAYLSRWSRQTGIASDMYVQGEPPLSSQHEQNLFRVAQEALANVARHSQARHVWVRLTWSNDEVHMSIEDDGRGFHPHRERKRGLGVISMAERVASLGGELHIASAPGRGTRVKVSIPAHNGKEG